MGYKLIGAQGFELKKTVDKEHIYGSNDDPIDMNSGNKGYTGSISVLKFESDKFNDAALAAGYADITEVPHTLISAVIQYKKNATDKIRTATVLGIGFTELGNGMEQGAKMTKVALPFLAMKIIFK